MPTFTYKARDNKGELKESSILADNPGIAKASLKQQGLWVIDMKQIDERQGPNPFASKKQAEPSQEIKSKTKKEQSSLETFLEKYQPISLKDMVIFSRQFASMVEAGVAMLRALNVLTDQTQNPRLRKALMQIKYEIEQGRESIRQR